MMGHRAGGAGVYELAVGMCGQHGACINSSLLSRNNQKDTRLRWFWGRPRWFRGWPRLVRGRPR